MFIAFNNLMIFLIAVDKFAKDEIICLVLLIELIKLLSD
jgi:hypothetical protein